MLSEKIAYREWPLIAVCYEMPDVKTIEEIRHARLLQLLKSRDYPTIQALADKLEKSHAQVSQWKNRSERKNKAGTVVGVSNIDSDSARYIEEKVGKPRGWMDNDPAFDAAVGRPAPPAPPPGFADRHLASDSDWALLDDVKTAATDEEISTIRARAAKLKAQVERMVEERLTAAGKATAKAPVTKSGKDKA